jgi:tRNA modification GTPase
MDLSQAEAVRDVIEAKTIYQAQIAARQRSGELRTQLQPAKELLIDLIVQMESAVEFEEENLPLDSREVIARKLEAAQSDLEKWIASFRRGRLVREGFNMAIIGRPNAGKSSLFNALLARDRSIVAELPGTTRDLVSEDTNIEGIPVRLVDTAGVRPSEDHVERLGMDRSYRAMADADALLLVADLSKPPAPEDEHLRERIAGLPGIVVLNKSDLPSVWSAEQKETFAAGRPRMEVSAKTGANIAELRNSIFCHLFGDGAERESFLVTNLRHCRCMESAREALARAAEALRSGHSEEFALVGLRAGLNKLGEITGETTVEDLLGQIFSRFCVGK